MAWKPVCHLAVLEVVPCKPSVPSMKLGIHTTILKRSKGHWTLSDYSEPQFPHLLLRLEEARGAFRVGEAISHLDHAKTEAASRSCGVCVPACLGFD